MDDDLRPRGTVEVQCRECQWSFWLDALDPKLPDGPFMCHTCEFGPDAITEKAED